MAEQIFEKLQNILGEIRNSQPQDAEELEKFRLRFVGSKNVIKGYFAEMRNIEPEKRKEFGLLLNQLKDEANEKFASLQKAFENKKDTGRPTLDLTAPGYPIEAGARHPVSIVMNQIIDIFSKIGFKVVENREIENEWYNFTALNTPEDHPARDMTDTYYLKFDPQRMLRSQTSTVQVHEMEKKQLPIRIISPGRVYRNETVSARSHCQFHQVEGLYVDEKVTFADMKQVLNYFARELYGPDVKIRLRPSYFPFTEPSAEMDVYWGLKTEADYRMTKGTGWLEILGCGMVDPNVLSYCGIDPEKYSGFAFGMGIERQALRKYKINDIRLFFENDIRFLKQFVSA